MEPFHDEYLPWLKFAYNILYVSTYAAFCNINTESFAHLAEMVGIESWVAMNAQSKWTMRDGEFLLSGPRVAAYLEPYLTSICDGISNVKVKQHS